jgi:predicted TIM-barrel fold metal-dependent hydrolase
MAIPISAMRTRLVISMSNPYGNSGHTSKNWMFQFICTPEFRYPTSNVFTKVTSSAWGFGFKTSTRALRMILSGLFDKYPKLSIILGDLSEALPFTLPPVEHRLRHQKRETHGKHERPPMDYLRDNFYLTTSGMFRTL